MMSKSSKFDNGITASVVITESSDSSRVYKIEILITKLKKKKEIKYSKIIQRKKTNDNQRNLQLYKLKVSKFLKNNHQTTNFGYLTEFQ